MPHGLRKLLFYFHPQNLPSQLPQPCVCVISFLAKMDSAVWLGQSASLLGTFGKREKSSCPCSLFYVALTGSVAILEVQAIVFLPFKM